MTTQGVLPLDTAAQRKARGAFFTPPELCRYLVDWAVRKPTDHVLEPSCGEAAFLLAAAERLAVLGGDTAALHGIELHPPSAEAASQLLREAGHVGRVRAADFFTVTPEPVFDAVVGNPPYVRYQEFSGASRARARLAASRAGVDLSGLASSWAPFTVHAALFLKAGGRLGLVLPAELLSTNYAAGVRRFLLRRFGRVRLLMFAERVFGPVLEEVVLLLAEGKGPADRCEVVQLATVDDLRNSEHAVQGWRPVDAAAKWTPALLPARALQTYEGATSEAAFTTLRDWGETKLGAVTGNNRYFALTRGEASARGLSDEELLPISPPGSRHLRGLSFDPAGWETAAASGARALLFRPPGPPSLRARTYIGDGERGGVHTAYKCRVRTPWWRVPLSAPADLLLTYMNADTPRITTNGAGVHHLNSIHGVYLGPDLRGLGREVLPLGSLNTVTLLGAELVGRAYGGGMLKLEPGEADCLPVPAPAALRGAGARLLALRDRVDGELRGGRLLAAVHLIDMALLVSELGMSPRQVAVLAAARETLFARRMARSGNRLAAAVVP